MGDGRDDPVRLGRYRGRFCAVVGAGRSRQRISLGTADPGLARTRLAEFVQQRDRLSRPNRVTVGAILAAYLFAGDVGIRASPPTNGLVVGEERGEPSKRAEPVHLACVGEIPTSHVDLCKQFVELSDEIRPAVRSRPIRRWR